MGSYDTFVGMVNCPWCRRNFKGWFQTKMLGEHHRLFHKGSEVNLESAGIGQGLELIEAKVYGCLTHHRCGPKRREAEWGRTRVRREMRTVYADAMIMDGKFTRFHNVRKPEKEKKRKKEARK